MSVRVVVVDDHPLVRAGFRFLAESGSEITVVGEAATAREAVEVVTRTRPDVVVMDIGLGEDSGIDAAVAVKRARPETRVLYLTMHDDRATILRSLQAGGDGYVVKGAAHEQLLAAIVGVAGGSMVLGPAASDVVLGSIDPTGPAAYRFPALSDRENQVLELLATGASNRVIADRLGVARKTVANHVATILAKLHATDRTHAVVLAREAGYAGD